MGSQDWLSDDDSRLRRRRRRALALAGAVAVAAAALPVWRLLDSDQRPTAVTAGDDLAVTIPSLPEPEPVTSVATSVVEQANTTIVAAVKKLPTPTVPKVQVPAIRFGRTSFVITGYRPVPSANGLFLGFTSMASNLVPGDTNGKEDVFVRNQVTGAIERVSVSSSGTEPNDHSFAEGISGDGRFVVFSSAATNLAEDDAKDGFDVFLRDRQAQTTVRIAAGSNSTISDNGRFIAFQDQSQVRLYDRDTGETSLVSRSPSGEPAQGENNSPSLSGDGRFVAFTSRAANIDGATGAWAVFVHDTRTGQTERISEGESWNSRFSLSPDGRFVAFETRVPGTDGRSGFQVHLRDRVLRSLVKLTQVPAGDGPGCVHSSVSSDGRAVAFECTRDGVIPGDTNGAGDVFVVDVPSGKTTRVSVSSSGTAANGLSHDPVISRDGRLVFFPTTATNLAPGATSRGDLLVHERLL